MTVWELHGLRILRNYLQKKCYNIFLNPWSPKLNGEIITNKITSFMTAFENNFNKRLNDAIEDEYKRLLFEQSKLLNNSGMVWIDKKLEWRPPAELVEPEITLWRNSIQQKMQRMANDTSAKHSVLELKLTATEDSYITTVTQLRNANEEERRRHTVFTKEQMRPTKWSTDDPIFISAFSAL